jgi:hypothetical protein
MPDAEKGHSTPKTRQRKTRDFLPVVEGGSVGNLNGCFKVPVPVVTANTGCYTEKGYLENRKLGSGKPAAPPLPLHIPTSRGGRS